MKINAEAYVEAVKPPEFIAQNGKTYIGRLLSFDQMVKLEPKLRKLNKKEILKSNLKEQFDTIRAVTNVIFPKPKWKIWERSCSYWLMKLPPHVMLRTFFSFLVVAMGQNMTPSQMPMMDDTGPETS